MERNIPHVLDVFTSSPGARRRHYLHANDAIINKKEDLDAKNPGSDSAISLSEDEDEKNISKYFDYLNEDDDDSVSRRKKKKKERDGKENYREPRSKSSDRDNHKGEGEIKQIERHLSMKKTIRKKMMRDLQQAFVEDPGEFQQDHKNIPQEKKQNIDIRNLTISKGKLSKSEHNFLDMLKDDAAKEKEKKGFKNLKNQKNKESKEVLKDDDSGHGSPSRELPKSKSKQDVRDTKESKESKEEKKTSFWKKLTGKGKSKR
ncbi:unnamed protein product [Meganyctiphanes norvegica]|uniref:Uncharacterized protein n=1 Tax=Meganyctiphanes norvegica TaxID=48144 RepID=A0AAV2PMZ7_MEGNR